MYRSVANLYECVAEEKGEGGGSEWLWLWQLWLCCAAVAVPCTAALSYLHMQLFSPHAPLYKRIDRYHPSRHSQIRDPPACQTHTAQQQQPQAVCVRERAQA